MEQSQHNEIQRSLGKIEGMLKESMKNNDANFARINGRLDSHATDIKTLQSGQTALKTKATILIGAVSFVVVGAWEFVKSQFK